MSKQSDERQAAELAKLLREIVRDLGAGILATDLREPFQKARNLATALDRRYTITSGVNAKGLRFVKSSFNPAPAPDPQSARAGEVCDLLGRLQEDAKHGDKAKAEDVAKLLTLADSLDGGKAPDGAGKEEAGGGETPGDLIATAVAVRDYRVSRSTLRRLVADGTIRDWRKRGHKGNAALILSRADVAAKYPSSKK
jgi:hypothetical protein